MRRSQSKWKQLLSEKNQKQQGSWLQQAKHNPTPESVQILEATVDDRITLTATSLVAPFILAR